MNIDRFHFKNQVVFRRVPAVSGTLPPALATATTLQTELKSSPVWANVTITRTPNFFRPEGSAYGFFFVEFQDNATSRTLKDVCATPVYLNGELCFAVKTRDAKPSVPQCSICLRWGHRTHLCRSPSKRCWRCGGAHDERSHLKNCGACQEAGKLTGVCGHADRCLNCGGNHRADSKECRFYLHRRDAEWIRSHAPRLTANSSKTGAPSQVSRGRQPTLASYMSGSG